MCRADQSVEGGEAALESLLAEHPEVTAVFTFNDIIAIGALRGARRIGRVHHPYELRPYGCVFDCRVEEACVVPVGEACGQGPAVGVPHEVGVGGERPGADQQAAQLLLELAGEAVQSPQSAVPGEHPVQLFCFHHGDGQALAVDGVEDADGVAEGDEPVGPVSDGW
ncbi:hypothetical protein [Streptomyces sp. Ag109_G2-15]|uniref:hypothetical protein n=1 Tax=Streptomyces sp. Ag109_G2-15 TaxID=1938850 RepID=UPI00359C4CA1